MKKDSYLDITLALAGVFQSAVGVNQLATEGEISQANFETSLASIFQLSPDNAESVFGGITNVTTGLKELLKVLDKSYGTPNPLISRYALSLLVLEKRLGSKPAMLKEIRRRLDHGILQINYFSLTHPTVISNLADIYQSTLSTLPFRVQLIGKAKFLHQEPIAQKIRALLLAGVRAAILWRQMGGRRWQLLFARSKMVACAKKLLAIET